MAVACLHIAALSLALRAPPGVPLRRAVAPRLAAVAAPPALQRVDSRSVLPPKEAYNAFVEKGAANANMPGIKMFHQAFMGGLYIGVGGLLSLTISSGLAGAAALNPGVPRFVFGALFPMNLLLIHCTGGSLFTGNAGMVSAAVCEGRATVGQWFRACGLSFIGNVVGAGLFALATQYAGLLTGTVAAAAATATANKCAAAFGPTLVKAIICNMLVCIAMFLAGAAQDLGGKMVGIWFPISAFVCIGAEHSVANMFLLPLGLLADAPVSLGTALWKNMLPVTLGNAIAGIVFVAMSYSYAFGKLGASD